MTQHMLIVLMATMVATFYGLIGCTGKGAENAAIQSRAAQVHPRADGSSGQHPAGSALT